MVHRWATISFRGARVKLSYIEPYPIMRNFQCSGEGKRQENQIFYRDMQLKEKSVVAGVIFLNY